MLERARYMAKPVPEQRQPSPLTLLDPVNHAGASPRTRRCRNAAKRGFLSVLDATASSLGDAPAGDGRVAGRARGPHAQLGRDQAVATSACCGVGGRGWSAGSERPAAANMRRYSASV